MLKTKGPKLTGPESFLKHLNPDGGFPYASGMPSFSEPTLLMTLAFIAAEERSLAQPLVDWILRNRNADGSIGLNREFPGEGLWNTPLLAITMHHLGRLPERDAAIDFTLQFRSVPLEPTPENAIDTRLVGWPWVAHSFGWVEPTSWALLALRLAGKSSHARAVEGRRFLEDRCMPQGGWNYGNKMMFGNLLVPFWDTTAIALLALGEENKDMVDRNLELLEKGLTEVRSLYSSALVCLCLARLGKNVDRLRERITALLSDQGNEDLNIAHSAMGLMAISRKRVLTP